MSDDHVVCAIRAAQRISDQRLMLLYSALGTVQGDMAEDALEREIRLHEDGLADEHIIELIWEAEKRGLKWKWEKPPHTPSLMDYRKNK